MVCGGGLWEVCVGRCVREVCVGGVCREVCVGGVCREVCVGRCGERRVQIVYGEVCV